ncbi:HerA-ATP synthase, barrel domain-containing protein [Gloeomargarita lithophora Alchichica-D10]|uniref:HerA-ATP synthase, barrel domain-containing protein n=1 Tax=Gloeomargarita lithophora Alchichica-D10 TaxID=1188229 RepID=A0A1J0AD28_9CYAN|nr:HerA-ATP synthase, barrel domain-containing protein [Gloeomargarita lithophora Alchichica-D10]
MRLSSPQVPTHARHPQHLAEVVETSTSEFCAQCLEPPVLDFPVMPPFGCWVRAADNETQNQIFGIVYHVSSSPIDAVHRTRALGLSLTELREQQPQIFAMLKTEFRAVIVGFQPPKTRTYYHYLPPRPPQIHQAVYQCTKDEMIGFTDQLEFLRTLTQLTAAPVDSLVGAVLRYLYEIRQADSQWLIQAGRKLNLILKDDYDRLRAILEQCKYQENFD